MALSYPLDILADFPGRTTDFGLVSRDEYSRTAGGVTYAKNFGNPLWQGSWQSLTLPANLLDEWRARLDALENGLKTFKGYPLSRTYPIAYPKGSWPTGTGFNGSTATIYAVGSGNRSLRVDLLPPGFQLRIGDMLQVRHGSAPVRYDLYRVMESATATSGGVTPEFEVRPHLWPGMAVDNLVSVYRPWCLMQVVPGSIQASADPGTGNGSVSFQGIEARDI